MNYDIRPAHAVFIKSSNQRELRIDTARNLLMKTIPDLIARREEEGYYSCTLSFIDADMNIDYDQRDIFIEEFEPVLKSLGYKVVYSDVVSSRHVSIDWDERFKLL